VEKCLAVLKHGLGSFTGIAKTKEKSSHLYLNNYKKETATGHQQLMPIVLATQEAEIRRSKAQSQSMQIVLETLSWGEKKKHKTGLAEWLKQ
jgi:hypothetical protein